MIRRVAANQHGVNLDGPPRTAFRTFLNFLKAVLNGQSALRARSDWVPQSDLLAETGQILLPQKLIREQDAQSELDRLVKSNSPAFELPSRHELNAIVDEDIENLCAKIYRRDYLTFGFSQWTRS